MRAEIEVRGKGMKYRTRAERKEHKISAMKT